MPLKFATQKQKPLIWNGSFFVHHSLAYVNRELLLALLQEPEFVERFAPTLSAHERATFSPAEDERFHRLAELQIHSLPARPALTLRHRWPPDWSRPSHGKLIVLQPWEYGALPEAWASAAKQVDEIWAYSHYVRECYLKAGTPAEKVAVVPCGINPERFYAGRPAMDFSNDSRFRAIGPNTYLFLFVGGTIPRKGIDILLKAWQRSFTSKDDVALIIKDFGTKSFYAAQTAQAQIAALTQQAAIAPIIYLEDELTEEQIASLYARCHCLVHPYRGEGYALPVAEAMACGKPVIVTGQGAVLDFANEENAYLIPATTEYLPEARIGDIPTLGRPFWAKPDLEALVALLRHVAENPEEAQKRGAKAALHMAQNHTWAHAARKALDRLVALVEENAKAVAKPLEPQPLLVDSPSATALEGSDEDGTAFYKRLLRKAQAGEWRTILTELEVHQKENAADANLQNVHALALYHLGEVQKALEILKEALRKNPEARDLHHNLAFMLLHQGAAEEALPHALRAFQATPGELAVRNTLEKAARGVLQEARKLLRSVPASKRATVKSSPRYQQLMHAYQEAQKALQPTQNRPLRLSLCMIVKNEARFLANCLQSAKDVVDEIVVVDTGSSDETPQIARSFGAKVVTHTWNDDFSEARNVSLQHATGDWALWLDADEEIAPEAGQRFREAIANAPPDVGGYMVKIRNWVSTPHRNEQGEIVVHHAIRLFRLVPGVQFEGRVHEQNMLSLIRMGYRTAVYEGLLLDHFGYARQVMLERNKHERFIRMLQREVEECQDETLRPFQLFNLGNAYFTAQDMRNAVVYFQQAAERAQPDQEYTLVLYYEWALALQEIGQPEEALKVCAHAEALGLKHVGLEFSKGYSLLKLGRASEAEGAFRKALELAARQDHIYADVGDLGLGSYKAWMGLAQALKEQGRFDEVASCCREALLLREGFHEARHLLAQALWRIGHKEEARVELETLLEHYPTNEVFVEELAELLTELGDYEEAYAYWKRLALRRPSDLSVSIKWAVCCEALSKWEEALELYMRLPAQGKESPEIYVNMGRVMAQLNRIPEAIDCYTEAIRLAPHYGNAYFNAGDLLYKLGYYNRAADAYASGLQVEPQRRSGFFVLGNCYFQLGAIEAAIMAYKQELTLHPDHVEARHNLALAEALLGQPPSPAPTEGAVTRE